MNSGTLRGRTTGATIMFFFGALWLLLGLYAGRVPARSLRLEFLLAGMALVACIGIMVRRSMRQSSGSAPPSAEQVAVSQQTGRRFAWITAIEGGAIFLAIVLLNAVHRSPFIAPVIAIIVGLHFFPLASLFGARVYYATGSLGCAIGIMFRDASQRKFDVLLFWALDRLSREGVLETLQHLNRLTSYGVGYRSFTEQYFDSCGIFKDAVIAIIATVAKQERIRISQRVRAGLEVARAKGRRIGRPPQTQLSPEMRTSIAGAYASGGASLRALAKKFGTSLATVQRCVGAYPR